MKVSPSRLAAFDALWRVATEDAYASNLLASARYDHLSREDRALAQEMALGVLRWQIQLDFFIERYAQRKLDNLDQEVVIALRLGLYQLKFLSRIPPHAAINESVNLVKERGIDESRISVRSSAARKPADTGTSPAARAKNRRVEVVLVPEGAEPPE